VALAAVVAGPHSAGTLRQPIVEIQVRYFAVFRERIGREDEVIHIDGPAHVQDAIDVLEQMHSPIGSLRGRYRVAVNLEMVGLDHPLVDGDELVLIPPVAGGTGRHAVVLDGELSLDRVVAAVSGAEFGGIATFTGAVRRQSRGKQVARLEYEAYGAMAEKVFRELCDEVEAEFDGTKVAVEHRTGTLAIGDVAVVIAAAAPHRAEAFAACRAMIDRLKERAPIWKKEVATDGEEWVGLGP